MYTLFKSFHSQVFLNGLDVNINNRVVIKTKNAKMVYNIAASPYTAHFAKKNTSITSLASSNMQFSHFINLYAFQDNIVLN